MMISAQYYTIVLGLEDLSSFNITGVYFRKLQRTFRINYLVQLVFQFVTFACLLHSFCSRIRMPCLVSWFDQKVVDGSRSNTQTLFEPINPSFSHTKTLSKSGLDRLYYHHDLITQKCIQRNYRSEAPTPLLTTP